MITDRLPFGVVEMKSAWVSDDPARSGELTRVFARTAFPTMSLLGASSSWPQPRRTFWTGGARRAVWSLPRSRRRRIPATATAPR